MWPNSKLFSKVMNEKNLPANQTDFLLYTSATGDVTAEVFLKDETVWLTQKSMASLFGVKVPAINKHLKNIFCSGELDEGSVISILETTAADGKKYKTKFYNLDAIVSVGYRVNSYQATQFRIWATRTLKEYIIKGFVLDDERLKQGTGFLARITLMNCWNVSGKSEPVSGAFTRRSPIYMLSPLTTTKTLR